MYSLQFRLGTGLLVSLIILVLIQWVIVSSGIRYLYEDYILTSMDRDLQAVLAAVAFAPDNRQLTINMNRLDPAYERVFSGHYYHIVRGGDELRSRSLWDINLPVRGLSAGAMAQETLSGPQRQTLLYLARGFVKQGQGLTIAVAEDISHMAKDVARFQLRYGLVSGFILIALILLQVWIVRRNLRPLDQVRDELQALEQGQREQLSMPVLREVAPLITEINRLLQTMRQRMQRSRNAMGNLAHALKTPITLIQQLAAREELRQYPALREQLDQHIAQVRTMVERELKRSRLAGDALYAGQVELGPELDGLIHTLTRLHHERQLDFSVEVPAALRVNMDREDLLELLGNVLDNACKWARATVAVSVETVAQGLRIRVEDDGPGCPDDQLHQLARRGLRLDEEVAGSGLGLSIVKDIVQSYGGEIDFTRGSRLGGLAVGITLPVAVTTLETTPTHH